jgi:hypothetical protein
MCKSGFLRCFIHSPIDQTRRTAAALSAPAAADKILRQMPSLEFFVGRPIDHIEK